LGFPVLSHQSPYRYVRVPAVAVETFKHYLSPIRLLVAVYANRLFDTRHVELYETRYVRVPLSFSLND
jgi:hypothetical protein